MATKRLTYTGYLENAYYRSHDIDQREVVQLLEQAQLIPQQLFPFKGILHVIDYRQRRHVGLSGPVNQMAGYHPRDILDNGLDFIIDIFHQDDFRIYNEKIFTALADVLHQAPPDEHEDFLFSFTYRMRTASGRWVQLYQQGKYLTDPQSRLPLFSIALVTDITPIKKDNRMVFCIDKKGGGESGLPYETLVTEYYYPDPDEPRLTKREREILGWLADGLSSKQIAAKLYLSEKTVIIHRKNILKKTNTKKRG